MTDNRANLIAKISALMNKANDKSVTENEAALFMQKALDLLAKHNIDESELGNKVEEEVSIEETMHPVPMNVSWFSRLASQVAQMYFCKIYMTERTVPGRMTNQHYYVFVGKVHNRQIAINMYEYLMKTANRLANDFGGEAKARNEFKKGCCLRLVQRIYAINEENKVKVKVNTEGGSTNLPALYKTELALVEDHMNQKEGMRKARTRRFNTSNNAFHAGSQAANGIALNNQVGASARSATLKITN